MVRRHPGRDRLCEAASSQSGCFTAQQRAEADDSRQLLRKCMAAGRVWRPRRGVYPLVAFADGEHADLVLAWLSLEHAGVESHQTALSPRQPSDVLPAQGQLTLRSP